METEPPETPLTAAESRLHALLALLRNDPPEPPAGLTPSIVRAARFERGVRSTSLTSAALGAAFLDGLVLLLGLKRRP